MTVDGESGIADETESREPRDRQARWRALVREVAHLVQETSLRSEGTIAASRHNNAKVWEMPRET
jgi:hypothetical protein